MKKFFCFTLLFFSFFAHAQNMTPQATEKETAGVEQLEAYRETIREMDVSLTNSLNKALQLIVDIKNQDPAAIARNLSVSKDIGEILKAHHQKFDELTPPADFAESHEKLKNGLDACIDLFAEITDVLELASSTDIGTKAVAQTKFQGLVGKFNNLRPDLEQYSVGYTEIMTKKIEVAAVVDTKPSGETAPAADVKPAEPAVVKVETPSGGSASPTPAEKDGAVAVTAGEEKPVETAVASTEAKAEETTAAADTKPAGQEATAGFYDPATLEDVYGWTGDYLFPSDKERFTREYLESCSRAELYVLRNEIYARYGLQFGPEDLKTYFGKKAWYKPAPGNVDRLLTDLENDNVDSIVAVERKKGWR